MVANSQVRITLSTMEKVTKKSFLIILDGWGIGTIERADAIKKANTPFFNRLMEEHPNATLTTYGESVGLPDGQMGNSEVGHLNLGGGRIVLQDLLRINRAIESGELKDSEVLKTAIQAVKERVAKVHFAGLVSDGGVHSHLDHLIELVRIIHEMGVKTSYIHAFTDGRDTDPHSSRTFLKKLEEGVTDHGGVIASVVGRYYAMDRDHRWERTKTAYDLMVHGVGGRAHRFEDWIFKNYEQQITDEFLNPVALEDENGIIYPRIQDGDLLISFNFRSDRPRQILKALVEGGLDNYEMPALDLFSVSMTRYDDEFDKTEILFDRIEVSNGMGEWMEKLGKSQLRMAETEKYPHVTYFFSGGREELYNGESRILVPSPKVATYDLLPAMSAGELTEQGMAFIEEHCPDFVCLNYANTDMVGHTGVFDAAVDAAEFVDACLSQIVPLAQSMGYEIIITADHGNADFMINEDGTPNTAHSMNPVPIIVIGSSGDVIKLKDGVLADVSPTILDLMEIEKPAEMTGKTLLIRK